MDTSSFSPNNLSEEGKRLLAVTSFEATMYVFIITDNNSSFSSSAPRQWYPEGGAELFDRLFNLSEHISKNDKELLNKEVEKRGTRIEMENSG